MIEKSKVNILLVDDQPGKLLTYESILRGLAENLIAVKSADEALGVLLKTDVALILMDVCLPGIDGFELARIIRQHPRHERTAIIFVSGVRISQDDLVRGYETGGVDYVSVPVVPEILLAKVKIFVELYRNSKMLAELNEELETRVAERTRELEKSNARLRESEERLRLASLAARFVTYEYDAETNKLKAPADAAQLLGEALCSEGSLRAFLDHVHPEDRVAVEKALREPEGDSEIEFRLEAAGKSPSWFLNRCRSFEREGHLCSRVLGTFLDINERKNAEEHQGLLMAELDHRVKNVLANVMAMARLSSGTAGSVPQYVSALTARLQSMASAHDLLRKGDWRGADFSDLVNTALSPFAAAGYQNIAVDGPSMVVTAKSAQTLALVLHELATNAVKYGALSVPAGSVDVRWEISSQDQHHFVFHWQERGGPEVSQPQGRGFGMCVLESAGADGGGPSKCTWHPDGFAFSFRGSLLCISPGVMLATNIGQDQSLVKSDRPAPRCSVLVVEDEPLIAMQLQMDLEDDGHYVLGPATTLAEGLQLARAGGFEVAVLDVNLGGQNSVEIADVLIERGIPFALATGFNDVSSLPVSMHNQARISKPYDSDQLRALIKKLTDKRTQVAVD